jgi:hypothetical protein
MAVLNTSIRTTDEIYLQRNSLFWLLAGIMFVSEALYIVLNPFILASPWLQFGLSVLYFPLIVITVKHTINVIKLMSKIPEYNIWDGYFEDQHFEYINNQGIKYSLAILVMFLSVNLWIGIYLPDFFANKFPHVSLNELSTLAIGLVMLGYGLTVACLLKRNTTNMFLNM